jgi:hypothetical protein
MIEPWFRDILARHARVAICGGPRTGKTTLSRLATDRKAVHSDDFINMGWSEASTHLVFTLNKHGAPFVVEGVAVARALRKGLRVDCAVWLDAERVPLSSGQQTMSKAVRTVFNEWRAQRPDVEVCVYTPVYRSESA